MLVGSVGMRGAFLVMPRTLQPLLVPLDRACTWVWSSVRKGCTSCCRKLQTPCSARARLTQEADQTDRPLEATKCRVSRMGASPDVRLSQLTRAQAPKALTSLPTSHATSKLMRLNTVQQRGRVGPLREQFRAYVLERGSEQPGLSLIP